LWGLDEVRGASSRLSAALLGLGETRRSAEVTQGRLFLSEPDALALSLTSSFVLFYSLGSGCEVRVQNEKKIKTQLQILADFKDEISADISLT